MEDEQAAIDAVLKFAVLALVVGALLGLATFAGVKLLGLGGGGPSDTPYSLDGDAPSALPTKALEDPSSSPSESPSATPSESEAPDEIELSVSPGQVAPGQQINFTGTYPQADNVLLKVQRMEGGAWADFADVQVPVRVGTFASYIITSRTGEQEFRVFDPQADLGSNSVTVTVG